MTYSILIADDEAAIRESLSMVLTDEGYECHCVENGRSAINEITKRKYDLLIIDFLLPDKNGMEILKTVKEIDSEKRIIVTSSYLDWAEASTVRELGVNGIVLKPFDFDELLCIVQSSILQGYTK